MDINIQWTSQTSDGLFGLLSVVDGGGNVQHSFPCVTNLADRILDGTYMARVDMSPRLQYLCPHIKVPLRDSEAGGDAGLRIHIANFPSQSLGCIFPGLDTADDAVENSHMAFNSMMSLLPQDDTSFTVSIEINL